jgi:hypothetical protein
VPARAIRSAGHPAPAARGVKDFAITSGGVKIPNPRTLAAGNRLSPGISAGWKLAINFQS